MTSRSLDVAGRSVEIFEGGSGDPVVFLHGGSLIGGIEFLEPLTEGNHVVAPLLPGFGATELDPPVEGADAVTDHLADVLDALGIERAIVIAHSLGGWRAARFAARPPERVSRLVLGAPLGMLVAGHPVTNMVELSPAERLDVLTYDDDIKASWTPAGPDPEFIAARTNEQVSMMRFSPGLADEAMPEVLANVKVPVLILWGEGDRLTPVEHAQAWAAALPDARVQTYPGAGHLVFHERPESVTAILTEIRSEGV